MSLVACVRLQGRILGADGPAAQGEPVGRPDQLHGLWQRLAAEADATERTPRLLPAQGLTDWETDHRASRKPYALDAGTVLERPARAGPFRWGVGVLGEAGVEALTRASLRWTGARHTIGHLHVLGESVTWTLPPVVFSSLLERVDLEAESMAWRLTTPTAIRSGGGVELPFPEPRAVFRGLQDRASLFLGWPDDLGGAETAAEFPRVSRFDLRTRLVLLGRRKFVGCEGTLVYDLRHLPLSRRRSFQALGVLAEVAGVGHATPYGMGHVRRLDDERPTLDNRRGRERP